MAQNTRRKDLCAKIIRVEGPGVFTGVEVNCRIQVEDANSDALRAPYPPFLFPTRGAFLEALEALGYDRSSITSEEKPDWSKLYEVKRNEVLQRAKALPSFTD